MWGRRALKYFLQVFSFQIVADKSGLIRIDFDDGDEGEIPISDVRILPASFPITSKLFPGFSRRWVAGREKRRLVESKENSQQTHLI